MSKFRFITDSPSDIPDAVLTQFPHIVMLRYPIVVDGREYREREDFTIAGFYDVLTAAKEIPLTAHANLAEHLDAYTQALADGVRHVVVCVISSAASNSFHTAQMAKNAFLEQNPDATMTIDIVDSLSYSLGYGIAVEQAAALTAQGDPSREEVLALLEDFLRGHTLLITMFNLDYARKSGRINTVAAFVGEMLGFRPILFVNDKGVIETLDKVRGDHNALEALAKLYMDRRADADTPYYLAHGAETANAENLERLIQDKNGKGCVLMRPVGAAIAINAGPTVVGLLFRKGQQ